MRILSLLSSILICTVLFTPSFLSGCSETPQTLPDAVAKGELHSGAEHHFSDSKDAGEKDTVLTYEPVSPEHQGSELSDAHSSKDSSTGDTHSPTPEASEQLKESSTPEELLPEQGAPELSVVEKPAPEPTPNCNGVGTVIRTGQTCCKGLKAVDASRPPQCKLTQGYGICTKCGDGKCDPQTGESFCNCEVDCPKPTQCKVDGDCGKPSCSNSGTTCLQVTPRCSGGKCASPSGRKVPNQKCDTSTGLCKP